MRFSYILDKIREASFQDFPFNHIQINGLFSEDDFSEIVSASEVALKPQPSDDKLFDALFGNGYKIIDFPGCITNKGAYKAWHKDKSQRHNYNNTSCEGFGVTVRLVEPKSKIIADLMTFLNSVEFQKVLAEKFSIDLTDVFYDAGIQKYLDGYEISPHSDSRKKALTFMVNINPGKQSEKSEHHTHYLQFKEPYKYVQAYWEGNPNKDRCWVPWDWCESKKIQTENNSMVIFSPDNDTIHGVKARYDHLSYQRTQLYGNLRYHERRTDGIPAWENFIIRQENRRQRRTLKNKVASVLPRSVKEFIKRVLRKDDQNVISNRLKRD